MKQAAFSFILLCSVLVHPRAFPQSIQSPIINLSLPGAWQGCPEIQEEMHVPDLFAFCDRQTGSLVRIRAEMQLRSFTEISGYFARAGREPASLDVAKFLVRTVFPVPDDYLRAVAPSLHGKGKAPRMWEVKTGGNLEWFYVSQLFSGYRVSGGGGSFQATEEYYPARVTRAEPRSAPGGDALVLEAETEKPAMDAAIKRFSLPDTVSTQRLRYGWVQYAPGGISAGTGVVSVVFASPVNSGLDVTSVLDQVIRNFGKSAAGLQ